MEMGLIYQIYPVVDKENAKLIYIKKRWRRLTLVYLYRIINVIIINIIITIWDCFLCFNT